MYISSTETWLIIVIPAYLKKLPGGNFPSGSVGKEYACNAGDPGLIPGLGRSHGEGDGNPLQ